MGSSNPIYIVNSLGGLRGFTNPIVDHLGWHYGIR